MNVHACIKDNLKRECAICMEDMHSSRDGAMFLRCGHAMHSKCQMQYLFKGNIACPLCKKSVVDPKNFEE